MHEGFFDLSGGHYLETLKENKNFKRVYEYGYSRASKYLVLYWLENSETKNRYGFSISTKVGKAVQRNKIRRRLKEIIRYQEKKENLQIGFDVVFIVRQRAAGLEFSRLKKNVIYLFSKAGLYKKKEQQ